MSTLANPAALDACLVRVERLTPNSSRLWAKMTPHQMVCHLGDAFRMGHGIRMPADISNFFTRSVIRYVALHTSMKWPSGARTVPEADQLKGGTPPVAWREDCSELVRLMRGFPGLTGYPAHPMFGQLSRDEWMVWGYRHTDHHLRQFGV